MRVGGADTRALYLGLLFQPAGFRYLELAPCQRVADTVRILDTLLLLLSPHEHGGEEQQLQQHGLTTVKLKLFASASMSMEESYLVKRFLR